MRAIVASGVHTTVPPPAENVVSRRQVIRDFDHIDNFHVVRSPHANTVELSGIIVTEWLESFAGLGVVS